MFAGRNVPGLVARNFLISIEVQTIFGFSRKAQNRQGKRAVVDAVDLLREGASGEGGVQGRSADSKHRGHRQYHGHQSHEP